MGVKERKEREREQQKELILRAASDIVKSEGIDKLSVRKIADKIEYSPAIIYHYFKDKDEILSYIMKNGYQKILEALSEKEILINDPVEKLSILLRNYINVALDMKDEFKNIQLNDSPAILEHTSSMFRGASSKKPALGILTKSLKEIYKEKDISDDEIELMAQIIVVSTFGFIIKLIIEDIDSDQKDRLINYYIKYTIEGVTLRIHYLKEKVI